MNNDILPALEQAAAILADVASTSAELSGAAKSARASVLTLEEALAGHSAAKAEIFGAIAPPAPPAGAYRQRARSIRETLDAVLAHGRDCQIISAQREIAAWLAAELDGRARDAAKDEARRDAERKPFREQKERAENLAKIFAGFQALAKRIVELLSDDVLITKLGKSAYSNLPPPQGTHTRYVRTWHVPRVLATEEIMGALRLPALWPLRFSDFSAFEQQHHFEDEDDEIIRPIRGLINRKPLSESEVDAVIARAQAHLLAEYRKAAAAIEDLLSLDGGITEGDRGARYPDGEPIFNPAMFPKDWLLGKMRLRIKLPSIGGLALAAE
jgi:hypothetical protein